jgi:hypothetical protein
MVPAPAATCAKCGVTVDITNIGLTGSRSYVMKPGLPLAQRCPVMIEREEAGKPPIEECPNLAAAIDARIEQFRKEHS